VGEVGGGADDGAVTDRGVQVGQLVAAWVIQREPGADRHTYSPAGVGGLGPAGRRD
jgi:hypothetical protein